MRVLDDEIEVWIKVPENNGNRNIFEKYKRTYRRVQNVFSARICKGGGRTSFYTD